MQKLITEFKEAASVILTNGTGTAFTAGQVVDVTETLHGCAHGAIANGDAGTVVIRGRVKISKDATLTIAIGDALYYDKGNSVVTNVPLGNYIGMATKAAASTDTEAELDLNASEPVSAQGGQAIDMIVYEDDFIGDAFLANWGTVSVGSATQTILANQHGGVAELLIAAADEAEDAVLYHSDNKNFDIDKLKTVEFRAAVVTPGAGITAVWGMAGNHNLDKDTVAQNAWFRLDASLALDVETDDGTNDNDDKTTGITLVTATQYWFKIDFTDTADVKFYVKTEGATTYTRVASGTTFDMSNYTANLQPYFSLDKASGTGTAKIHTDKIRIVAER